MFYAFSRLVLIALISLICIFLGVYGLRGVGTNQAYSNFKHPLIDKSRWIIADGGDLDFGPAQSLSALRAASRIHQNIFLGLKIRTSLDGRWVLYAPTRLEELTNGSGFVVQKNLTELKSLGFKSSPNERLLELSEVFKEFPNSRFYIDVMQPGATQLNALYSLLKEYKLERHIVLTSQFQDTLADIRSKSAQWLTGSSTAEYSKSEFMSAIFLETVANFEYDVYITKKYKPRLLSELERRKKIVIFTLDSNSDLLQAALAIPQAGLLTKRPTYFMQMVDSASLSH